MFNKRNQDYLTYRGKCKELCEELCKNNADLKIVKGWYHCPIWNTEEQHYWCEDKQGDIVDPSAKQFPSEGNGLYKKFNGLVKCEECGKEFPLEEAYPTYNSHYLCSSKCFGKFVGII